ncbi:hypothetical protein ACO0LF_25670 [Undibacterium sp. Di27W]|uniref:hypothetical protein n=1 Tax=Undibacterium sp. Di27W TaxID=3413036 RepID=UPI003BF04C0A
MDSKVTHLPAPQLRTLPAIEGKAAQDLLRDFRAQLGKTVWGTQTPDTLLGPVESALPSLLEFETDLQTLYRALLKVLVLEREISHADAQAHRMSDLMAHVRRFNHWPVMNEGILPSPEILLAEDATKFMFGRPDIVLSAEGPKVVETNFDTGIGGYLRPDDIWKIAAQLFILDDETLAFGSPLDGFAKYFSEVADKDAVDFHWIMKDKPEIRQEMDVALQRLNSKQDNVFHRMQYTGEVVPSLRKGRKHVRHRACSIYTVKTALEQFTSMLQALLPATQAETVPLALSVLDSKLMLAWISDPAYRPGNLSDAEIRAVDRLIPWTRVLAFLSGGELAEVRNNREEFVIKKTDSFQARDVHLGWNTTHADWNDLITELSARAAWDGSATDIWIVQRRVRPRAQALIEYTDQGVIERSTGVSCCPYMMGGKLRGLETWVTPFNPDFSMIHKMQFVPHFIRA